MLFPYNGLYFIALFLRQRAKVSNCSEVASQSPSFNKGSTMTIVEIVKQKVVCFLCFRFLFPPLYFFPTLPCPLFTLLHFVLLFVFLCGIVAHGFLFRCTKPRSSYAHCLFSFFFPFPPFFYF